MLARTAYHEAGHVVVAMALGLPVERVTIRPTETLRGSVRLDLPDYDAPGPILTPEQRVTIGIAELAFSLGGPIAEAIAFGAEDTGSWRDHAEADAAVDRTCDVAGVLSRQWRSWASARVESYLRQNWPLVERLVVALLMKPTLSGARVREITGPVPRLDLTATLNGIKHWSGVMAARVRA